MSHDGFDAVQATHNLLSEALAPTPVHAGPPTPAGLPEEAGLYIVHQPHHSEGHWASQVFSRSPGGHWYIDDRPVEPRAITALLGDHRLVRLITETEADL